MMPGVPGHRFPRLGAALPLFLFALVPATGSATAPWGDDAALSTPNSIYPGATPRLAVAPDGAAVAVWAGPGIRGGAAASATRSGPGRAWTPFTVLSTTDSVLVDIDAAIAPGAAFAAFTPRDRLVQAPGTSTGFATERRLGVRTLAPGGSVLDRTTLLSPPAEYAQSPAIAADGRGNAIAVWTRGFGPFPQQLLGVEAAERSAATGAWSGPMTISPPGAHDVRLAENAAGDAVAVWVLDTPAGPMVQAAVRPAAGGWGPPETVAAAAPGIALPAVAVGGDGTAVAVWYQGAVMAAVRPPGGAWGPAASISAAGTFSTRDPAAVAVGGAGDAVASWRRAEGGVFTVEAALRPAGGGWGGPSGLSVPGDRNSGSPAAAIGPGGRTLVVWSQPVTRARSAILARAGTVRSGFGGVEQVSSSRTSGVSPAVGMDAAGRATAVWLDIDYPAGRLITVRAAERPATPVRPPAPIEVSADQLLINRRIAQTAARRLAAVQAHLDGGLTGADIRDGSLGPEDFAATVQVGGVAAPGIVAPGPLVTLRVAPAARVGRLPLRAREMLVSQRIAQAAIVQARELERRLDAGLSGADFRDGSIPAAALAPGFTILSATPQAPVPVHAPPPLPPPSKAGRVVELTADQLRVNQRIAQEAVRRANALVDRVQAGFGGADIVDRSLTAGNLYAGVEHGT